MIFFNKHKYQFLLPTYLKTLLHGSSWGILCTLSKKKAKQNFYRFFLGGDRRYLAMFFIKILLYCTILKTACRLTSTKLKRYFCQMVKTLTRTAREKYDRYLNKIEPHISPFGHHLLSIKLCFPCILRKEERKHKMITNKNNCGGAFKAILCQGCSNLFS